MKIRVGNDILQLKKFQATFKKCPEKFERDVFFQSELENPEISHLAGLFVAKEAVIKALDLKPGSWRLIEIKNIQSGKPVLKFKGAVAKREIATCDLSISHHGDYVMAVVVILLK